VLQNCTFPHNINTLTLASVAGCAAMTETRGQTRRLTRWPPAVKPRTTGQALFVFNSSPVSSWRVGATHATISALSLPANLAGAAELGLSA
jgi:hypothetical protein